MNLLGFIALVLDVHDSIQENLMLSSDLAGFAALLVVLGGVVFWLMILFGAVVGVFRGIVRLVRSARDLLTPVNIDLELARRRGE